MLHKKFKVLIFFFICLIFCCAGIYAANKIERNFIGIELDENFFNLAVEWHEKSINEVSLFAAESIL